MHALVLGGNGFIGSYVVDELLAAGNRVRVFNRSAEKLRAPNPNVEYFISDFSDIASLAAALNGVDVVYHLISTTVPATSNLSPEADINGNLISTVKLLELMRQQSIPRIVYLSSGGTVYGIPDVSPIPELHPLRPICSYGVVKVAIENYLRMFHALHGIDYVTLRASNPYGARQNHGGLQGVIGTYINRFRDGLPIEVWGTGEVVRDFIHVHDLALLIVKAGHSDVVGTFNAGFGEGASILDIIDLISECSNSKITPDFKPGRSFDVPHVVLDITKTTEVFGWTPGVTLIDGIAHTLECAMDASVMPSKIAS